MVNRFAAVVPGAMHLEGVDQQGRPTVRFDQDRAAHRHGLADVALQLLARRYVLDRVLDQESVAADEDDRHALRAAEEVLLDRLDDSPDQHQTNRTAPQGRQHDGVHEFAPVCRDRCEQRGENQESGGKHG